MDRSDLKPTQRFVLPPLSVGAGTSAVTIVRVARNGDIVCDIEYPACLTTRERISVEEFVRRYSRYAPVSGSRSKMQAKDVPVRPILEALESEEQHIKQKGLGVRVSHAIIDSEIEGVV